MFKILEETICLVLFRIFINPNILLYMTSIASYPNSASAQKAYDMLIAAGIKQSNISVASRDPSQMNKQTNSNMNVEKDSDVVKDAVGGTTTGAVTGGAVGFLMGAAALTIPGFGPLLAAGPLAAAIGGSSLAANTAIGAAVGGLGGLASGLIKSGVDEAKAKDIETNLQNGGAIIAVKEDDDSTSYTEILNQTSPDSVVKIPN